MSNPIKPNSAADYLAAIFIFIIFGLGFFVFWRVVIVSKPTVEEVVLKAPDCPQSFNAYKKLVDGGQSIALLTNKNSYAAQGSFVKDYSVTLHRSGAGEIACGYLYLDAMIGNNKLDDRYDSIYIDPQGFGGHILRSKSIPIPTPNPSKTEVLLPLNSVSYLPNLPYNPLAQNYKIGDWVKILNATDGLKFNIAISTLNPRGIIAEVRIAYKCWNPDTGQENQSCQLSL